jgi:hypothetical protein
MFTWGPKGFQDGERLRELLTEESAMDEQELLTNNGEPAAEEDTDAGDECHCDSGSESDGPEYVYVCKMHRAAGNE